MSEPHPRPEVVASRLAHDGFLRLRVDTIRYGDGPEHSAEVIEHPGGVTIVAFDAGERLLLVRQYRHPAARDLLELPAGTLDRGESPEVCAARELREETGYAPGRLERLGGFYLAPGYCSEYQHIFLATGLSESPLEGEEPDLRLEPLPLEETLRLVDSGGIEDAKTVAALLLYLRRR